MISTQFVEAASAQLTTFVVIMARMSMTFTTLFIFNKEMVPVKISMILSLALALFVLMSGRVDTLHLDLSSPLMISTLMAQLFLGFIMGFIINLFIELFLALGQIISIQAGLGFVSLYVPRVGTITPLSRFFMIFATLLFFELNGHLVLINMMIDSFQVNFVKLDKINPAELNKILLFAKIIFSGSLMLSLSVIIALLISNITIAVMTKFAQQLNIFSIGINISLIIAFFVVYICFDAILENGTILMNDILRFADITDKSMFHHE